MVWRNSDTGYGLTAKLFHWSIALLILVLLGFGTYLAEVKISIAQLYLYGWHKSLGLLTFTLILLRIFWRFRSPTPPPLGEKNWQYSLAHYLHRFMYVLMVLMPLSGWIASSASGFPISFFGLFPLPLIAPESEQIETVGFEIHGLIGNLLLISIVLHLGGALQRHFVKKDATLKRMWF